MCRRNPLVVEPKTEDSKRENFPNRVGAKAQSCSSATRIGNCSFDDQYCHDQMLLCRVTLGGANNRAILKIVRLCSQGQVPSRGPQGQHRETFSGCSYISVATGRGWRSCPLLISVSWICIMAQGMHGRSKQEFEASRGRQGMKMKPIMSEMPRSCSVRAVPFILVKSEDHGVKHALWNFPLSNKPHLLSEQDIWIARFSCCQGASLLQARLSIALLALPGLVHYWVP